MQDEILEQPSFNPSIKMYLWQWVVAPFFLLIVILGVSNYFGEAQDTIKLTREALEITVDYPKKIRYLQASELSVELKNTSNDSIQNVQVQFDKTYMQNFSDIKSIPQMDGAYFVNLGTISPGQSKSLNIELDSKKHGTHKGEIILSYDNKNLPPVDLETTSFP